MDGDWIEVKRVERIVGIALVAISSVACRSTEGETKPMKDAPPEVSSKSPAVASGASGAQAQPAEVQPKPAAPAACPAGMNDIPAGTFWVGNLKPTYENEENPRFQTQVARFCADVTEVTTSEYEACVTEKKCSPPQGEDNKTCNTSAKGRGQHPINCIDYEQAVAVCARRGARLPTEVEWEYLARGGAEMRAFPWGAESPDGHACWKTHESCPVDAYPAAAFGLRDVAGNVWEWTSDWFGAYPWPAAEGRTRVIRGGGWSRRFDKWLSPTLRNRLDPKKWGSHLGVRCVLSGPEEACSAHARDAAGACVRKIESVDCLDGQIWNGVRCAKKSDDERCPAGTKEQLGHGCVREMIVGSGGSTELDLAAVRRARSPEFDEDCRTNQPTRPVAYRLSEGEHLARNAVGKANGCKNRDVGVGWNSTCCPE